MNYREKWGSAPCQLRPPATPPHSTRDPVGIGKMGGATEQFSTSAKVQHYLIGAKSEGNWIKIGGAAVKLKLTKRQVRALTSVCI